MLVFRWIILLLLLAAAVCFALYAGTGEPKFKRYGFVITKWTLIAAFVFFAVLAVDRLA